MQFTYSVISQFLRKKLDWERRYNSINENKAATEAEMEAYYRKRVREDDPMANF